MKNKALIIFLFVIFAAPIPIALLGALLCLIWFFTSLVQYSHILEVILSAVGLITGGTYIFTYLISLKKTWEQTELTIKSFTPLIHCIVALIYLLSLSPAGRYVANSHEYFGFAKKDYNVVNECNTHGGFLGDGYYSLVLDCSENKDKAVAEIQNWNKLPLSENLAHIMYGGERNGTTREGLAEEANLPEIKHGYYIFENRHYESAPGEDDSKLLGRVSFNFSLAVYDTDTHRFYYFEYDT